MPRPASRLLELGTESALDVFVRARALEATGRRVLHLEVGEPDFPTPEHIVEAGIRALRDGHTRYGAPAGLPALRDAIADHLAERGVRAEASQILVTPGAKPIVFYGILATVSPGDEVLIPDPGFPIYASMVRFCGGVPVSVPADLERGRALDLAALERALSPRTRLVIFNAPSNPTGMLVPPADLQRLAAICEQRDLWVMADEIYGRITYGEAPRSIAALPGMGARTIIIDGFSKSFAMTGWRLGWGCFPTSLIQHAIRLMINSNTCTASFVQHAGVAALRGPREPVQAMVAEFRRRRDVLVPRLQRIPGVRCSTPAGAFYAFPDVRGLPIPSQKLADRLLEEEGVAVLDGGGFGKNGAGHLRFSFAAAIDVIEEAGEALARLAARL
jgi:aspartate/methionine/tyrosine aminotransferase